MALADVQGFQDRCPVFRRHLVGHARHLGWIQLHGVHVAAAQQRQDPPGGLRGATVVAAPLQEAAEEAAHAGGVAPFEAEGAEKKFGSSDPSVGYISYMDIGDFTELKWLNMMEISRVEPS